MGTIRTLDISKNKLRKLGNMQAFTNLKSLNCDENKLHADALQSLSNLSKLQSLYAGNNKLGDEIVKKSNGAPPPMVVSFPKLPPSLKHLKLNFNSFLSIPASICSKELIKLEKLDLSNNDIAAIPEGFENLRSLVELHLDHNSITGIPASVGALSKLKVLSLRHNQIRVEQGLTIFTQTNPQPIHSTIFTDTLVVDLNLDGNDMTSSQLNNFEGFDAYLERRKKVKSKNLYGGTLTDYGLCGLE